MSDLGQRGRLASHSFPSCNSQSWVLDFYPFLGADLLKIVCWWVCRFRES